MSPEIFAHAGLILLAVIAYGVLAGADFGGGVWDALASGPRKAAQRDAIAHAIGPVWEANHVWLIFVIVLLFTAFPAAYAALSIGLFVPFHLVLLGITLRGAAFVFRAYGPQSSRARARWGAVFGAASVITPALLGASLGAVSAGRLRVAMSPDGAPRVWFEGGVAPYLAPVSLAMGALALALCAYLAAVYLTLETSGALREDFRRRALAAGTVVVAGSVLTLPLLYLRAPYLWRGLTSARAAPVVAAGVAAALASGWALATRHYRAARVAAVVQVALLLTGWGLAQYPHLIYPDLTLTTAAAPRATLRFVLYTLPVGAALLVPSLWMLFSVFKSTRADAARKPHE
jgi:cytochrome d ubiquinol oxidase subunit II